MAAPSFLDPPPMYCVRPYFDIKKVKLPDCMYMMKPLHQLPDKTGKGEAVGSALSYLEKRQEWVLSQVGRLQERVRALGQRLGISPSDIGVIQQATSGDVIQDIVISCPPSSPPYALRALYRYISQRIPATCQVHVHSSASQTTSQEMRRFFSSLVCAHNPQLKITLIWKSESICKCPTMVVSPHNQTPVEGSANISRYVCREFCPELYEGLGLEEALKIDSWLDLASGMLLYGSSKEKASVMRRLNSHLGSASYLVGDSVTLADIVTYVTICSEPGLKPTANVKQWMKRCQALNEFLDFPCTHLSNTDS